jgi:hypothetical protein
MTFFKNNSIRRIIGLAGIVTASISVVYPSLALSYSSNSNHTQELTDVQLIAQNQIQGLLDPEPGSWRCINNPNPVCKNRPQFTPSESDFRPGTWMCLNNRDSRCGNPPSFPVSEIDFRPGTWICLNNPNPRCENPVMPYP